MNQIIIRAFAVALCALAALAFAVAPNLDKAIDAQRNLVDERPGDPSALNDLANLLLLADRTQEAEETYRQALEVAPDSPSARFNLGLLLQRRGLLKEALAEYRTLVELVPDNAWGAYQIGSIYESWEQDENAVEWYGRAYSLDSRLFLADYNPQVIENHLVERSMIAGRKAAASRPLAPQVYDEPLRIRRLLVDMPLRYEGDGKVDHEDDGEGSEEEAVEGRVLAPDDLDDRALNQAASGARSNSRFGNRRSPSSNRVRTWNSRGQADRPQPKSRVGGGGTRTRPNPLVPGGVALQPTQPGERPTVPPRTVQPRGNRPTQPGIFSTGRLETTIIPEDRQG
ncbi:MAG: tetratricopeptide repeat protein [Acidobacteriota bacterium]